MEALALDIGGSGIRAARVRGDGTHGPVERRALSADSPPPVVRTALLDLLALLGPAPGDAGIGASIPSFVEDDGRIGPCPNLRGLEGVELGKLLAEAGALPARVVPDLAAAALAESRFGAGQGVERFLCVAVGTGVNAAATLRGTVVETAYGCLGDAGHVKVDADGPRCPCGGIGCLEAVASGVALARDGAPLGLPDGAAVIEAARSGHADAAALLERAGAALGRAIAGWAALLWPERVAVGGGLSSAGDLLLEPARRELRRVGTPYICDRIAIVPAGLGADAGLVGAGLAALDAAST